MRKLSDFLKTRVQRCLYAFVPLADVSQSPILSGLYSDAQNLSTYLNSIFKVAISVGAILAVLRLGYAGYMYMGSDLWGNKEKAKEMIRDVFIGIFLLLGVYVILYQINPNILKLNIVPAPIPATVPAAMPTASSGDQERLNAILADERRVRIAIQNINLNINTNNGGLGTGWCTSVTQLSGCTNVGLLPLFAINRLDSLQRACNCGQVIITGGTEFWMHRSHGPGMPVVDLRTDPALVAFVRNTYPDLRIGNTYTMRFGGGGGNFFYENAGHFHVTFF